MNNDCTRRSFLTGLAAAPLLARAQEAASDYSHRPRAEEEYVRTHPEPEFVPPGPARRAFDFWAAYNFHTDFAHAYYYRDTFERLFMPQYKTLSEADLGKEELCDNHADPYQMRNLAGSDVRTATVVQKRLDDLRHEAHDDFMAGPAYASWYDAERNIVRTGLGPVAG